MFHVGKRRARGASVLLAAMTAALLLPSLAIAEDKTVTIDNFAFTPQEITVKAGDKVTFVNHDDIPHSVVSKTQKFRSKALDTGDTFEFTFAAAGDYPYFCGLHPHMTGKVVATP